MKIGEVRRGEATQHLGQSGAAQADVESLKLVQLWIARAFFPGKVAILRPTNRRYGRKSGEDLGKWAGNLCLKARLAALLCRFDWATDPQLAGCVELPFQ